MEIQSTRKTKIFARRVQGYGSSADAGGRKQNLRCGGIELDEVGAIRGIGDAVGAWSGWKPFLAASTTHKNVAVEAIATALLRRLGRRRLWTA